MSARRLAGWSLWVELAAVARLITVWKGHPPILDERLGHDPCAGEDPGLAARLHRVIRDLELDIRPWGSPPLNTRELAEEFVVAEVAAATGLSHTRARQRVDAATALFLTDRLPRTAALLQAGLIDETKLRTVLSGTADLDDHTCRMVEARVISPADVEVADPLDVRADPQDLSARPGAELPAVTRMTNPALERALRAAVLAAPGRRVRRRLRSTAAATATVLMPTAGRASPRVEAFARVVAVRLLPPLLPGAATDVADSRWASPCHSPPGSG
jgi:Domain of unknown function (DUF222)